ncbi:hypothetical protein ASZ90_009401 [hydrocarbon metagenome]|uniref:Uncharacterized protein n=1 Tax=hydrocarbon metagenome TaxID=938273 RepID=A0A0W8FJ22_9ZZZZ
MPYLYLAVMQARLCRPLLPSAPVLRRQSESCSAIPEKRLDRSDCGCDCRQPGDEWRIGDRG